MRYWRTSEGARHPEGSPDWQQKLQSGPILDLKIVLRSLMPEEPLVEEKKAAERQAPRNRGTRRSMG
jgi:hypothetical protein